MNGSLRRLFATTAVTALALGALSGCVFLPALGGAPTQEGQPSESPVEETTTVDPDENAPEPTDALPPSPFSTSRAFIAAYERRIAPCGGVEHFSVDEETEQAGEEPMPALEGATFSSCQTEGSDYFIVVVLGPGKDLLTESQEDQSVLAEMANSDDFEQTKFGENWLLGATEGVDVDSIATEFGGYDIDVQ